MKILGLSLCAVSVCGVATMLTACGAAESPTWPRQSFPAAFRYASPERARTGCPCLYVANIDSSGGSVTVYPENSNGNVRPIASIAGSATGLAEPFGVSVGVDGQIYVANYAGGYEGRGAITVYPAGASGNVAPVRAITGLSNASGVAVDSLGFEYVTGGNGGGSVFVFAPFANGKATPVRTITGSQTQLGVPWGVVLDDAGNTYVANYYGSVTVYAAGANGNVAPIQAIQGRKTKISQAEGVAVDSSNDIHVANHNIDSKFVSSVLVFATGATGNVRPIRTIQGSKTKLDLARGIALDGSNNIYVTNGAWGYCSASVTVYGPGSTGNVRPIRTIEGDQTGLVCPQGIAIR